MLAEEYRRDGTLGNAVSRLLHTAILSTHEAAALRAIDRAYSEAYEAGQRDEREANRQAERDAEAEATP